MKILDKLWQTIWYNDSDNYFSVIDQSVLPHKFEIRNITSSIEAFFAIKNMQKDTSKIAANTDQIAANTANSLLVQKQELVLKLKDEERKERQDRDRLEEKSQKQYMDLMKDLAFEFKKEISLVKLVFNLIESENFSGSKELFC